MARKVLRIIGKSAAGAARVPAYRRWGMRLGLVVAFLGSALAAAFGQSRTDPATVYLTAGSLRRHAYPLEHLRYRPGDNPAWAQPGLDDAGWPVVNPQLKMPGAADSLNFRGICWFRLCLITDSTVAGVPLNMGFAQQGACEVYLDGKPLFELGKVDEPEKVRYYNADGKPVPFNIPTPGRHVLAIRYANYHARENLERYFVESAGLSEIRFGAVDEVGERYYRVFQVAVGFAMLWFGIFFALSLLHLLLFLYNRRGLPNLLFSLFTITVALLPVTDVLLSYSKRPILQNRWDQITNVMGIVACVLFSAFLNTTFPPGRYREWRYRIPAIIGAGASVLVFINPEGSSLLAILLLVAVAVESVCIIVLAVIRRKPGAGILGAGVLVLVLAVLMILLMFSEQQASSGAGSRLAFLAAFLALPVSISAYLARGVARTNKDLAARLTEVAELSEQTRRQEAEKQRILEEQNEVLEQEVATRTNDLRRQKQRSDDLLLNILPAEVAEELKEKGRSEARQYREVSVLFTDFVDFTVIAAQLSPQALVEELNACFTAFDTIADRHGLEKIKTIGDAYLAVCGLPNPNARHARQTVQAALEIRDFITERKKQTRVFDIRIGIHSGPVVAGVVGIKKFAYDIWGDTVNTAARMQQHGEPGKVNISAATYDLVKDHFECTPRGLIAAKNKGEVDMYFVQPASALPETFSHDQQARTRSCSSLSPVDEQPLGGSGRVAGRGLAGLRPIQRRFHRDAPDGRQPAPPFF